MKPSEYIDKKIAEHSDWRGRTMAEVRRIIRETVPDVTEELKWKGAPTWNKGGILCIMNPFKDMVKVTFLNGAQLGMDELFNAELEGNQWRAIKYFEGDKVNARGLAQLLLAAVAFNADKGKSKAKPAAAKAKPAAAKAKPAAKKTKPAAKKTKPAATKAKSAAAKAKPAATKAKSAKAKPKLVR